MMPRSVSTDPLAGRPRPNISPILLIGTNSHAQTARIPQGQQPPEVIEVSDRRNRWCRTSSRDLHVKEPELLEDRLYRDSLDLDLVQCGLSIFVPEVATPLLNGAT